MAARLGEGGGRGQYVGGIPGFFFDSNISSTLGLSRALIVCSV